MWYVPLPLLPSLITVFLVGGVLGNSQRDVLNGRTVYRPEMPHKASGWAGTDYATEAKQSFPALAGWWLKLVYTLVRYDPALPKIRNRFCRCAGGAMVW